MLYHDMFILLFLLFTSFPLYEHVIFLPSVSISREPFEMPYKNFST